MGLDGNPPRCECHSCTQIRGIERGITGDRYTAHARLPVACLVDHQGNPCPGYP